MSAARRLKRQNRTPLKLPKGRPPSQRSTRAQTNNNGMSPQEFCLHVARAECFAVRDILDEGKTIEKVVEIAENALGFASRMSEEATSSQTNATRALACRSNCSFCCHIPVSTDIPSVIRIAQHMRETFTPKELADARQRIEDYYTSWVAMQSQPGSYRRLQCPLLIGPSIQGQCSVYPVRPLNCQGWSSYDLSKCEAAYNDPEGRGATPHCATRMAITGTIQWGLAHGLRNAGLDSHPVNLVPALRIVLDEPDAAQRWLSGEDVFRTAWFTDDDPEYQAALKTQDEIDLVNIELMASNRLAVLNN